MAQVKNITSKSQQTLVVKAIEKKIESHLSIWKSEKRPDEIEVRVQDFGTWKEVIVRPSEYGSSLPMTSAMLSGVFKIADSYKDKYDDVYWSLEITELYLGKGEWKKVPSLIIHVTLADNDKA